MNILSKKGFTLIEILIALFILAIIAVIATAGLRSVINLQRGTRDNLAQLQQLQIAMSLLQRNINQIIDRPITNAAGQVMAPVVGTNQQITFTRAGFVNPGMVFKRSTLQRVRFYVSDGELIRATWPSLDQAPKTEPTLNVLLRGVTQMTIAYIRSGGQPENSWPLPTTNTTTTKPQQPTLPVAISLTLDLGTAGKITRLFILESKGFANVSS